MATTIHDVARHAGVSIKTVSNVINERQHVSAQTRQRVLEAVALLDYRPNLSARSLRSGRSGLIGLAVPELTLAYFAQLADEVIREAEARGLVVLVEQTRGGRRDRELEVLRSPRRQLTDGLLFSPLGMSQEDAHLVDSGSPVVLLGERIFGARADHVTMQNTEAAAAATAHLLAAGRSRIAVLGVHPGERIGSAGLRFQGYVQALADAGLSLDDDLVVEVGTWHRSNGAAAMRQLLDRGVRFDGVFAMNDELALGAMRVMQEHGVRIPQDVALIGFDDVDEGRYSLPSLTTVDPGRSEIVRIALDALMQRVAGTSLDELPPREMRSSFRIIERESTPRG